MIIWSRLRSIVYWILRRGQAEAQLDAELRAYTEMSAAEKVQEGFTPEEALRMAKAELGGIEHAKERVRTGRHGALIDSLWQDVWVGLRSLKANPRYSLVCYFTIALTVGGVATVFTLVNSVLLKPLPYAEPSRLLSITETNVSSMPGSTFVSSVDMRDILQASPSLEAVGLYRAGYIYTLDPDTDPKRIAYWSATSDLFSVLGIHPIRGRGLSADDDKPESPLVAVIGYDLWQWRFGGRQDIVGQVLEIPRVLNGRDASLRYEVVGVLPPDFKLPVGSFSGYPSFCTALQLSTSDTNRRSAGLIAIAKLRENATLKAARAEIEAASMLLAEAYPDTNSKRRAIVGPLLNLIVGDTREVLWIFFGAVCLVLSIGVANLASLQIVRNSVREREICIRAALGATRARLIRQLVIETLMWSGAGGLSGYFMARFGVHLLVTNLPGAFPRTDQIAVNGSVLVFALAISVVVGMLIGIAPAWRMSRPELQSAFNDGSRNTTMSARRGRLQQSLIAVEVAFAFVLLVGAGLLMNSFVRLFTLDAGIVEDRLWTASIRLPLTYRTPDQTISTWRTLAEEIRSLPQIEASTIAVNASPVLSGGDIMMGGLMPDDKPGDPRRDGVTLSNRSVGSDYFSTLGVSLLRGRSILASDNDGTDRVVVLNEAGARVLWPNEDALGKRIRFNPTTAYTVVGIVSNFRHRRLNEEPVPQMYTSYQQDQSAYGTATLMIRLKSQPEGFPAAVASIVSRIEPKATTTVASMADIRWKLVATERFRTAVLTLFAITAAFLAWVGIFGVVSYTVVQRNREIGLRMALGAPHREVLWTTVREAIVPTLVGLAVGVAGALGLTRLLTTFLFQIQVTDPLTFAGCGLLLFLAGLIASYWPARRATRIDPVIALRYE